jgi:signal transduction histidine kinase
VPDLIITDWEMPGMSGIDLIKKLKNNKMTFDIPVIMCTGVMTSSKNLMTARNVGAADYIRKPIDKIELLAITKANLHLADNYRKIKDLNDTKDKFFSNIGHDLRSPLNSLSAYTDLLTDHLESMSKEEIMTMSADLGQSVKNVSNLLENLLEWSRSQTGTIDFTPEKFDLTMVLEENRVLFNEIAGAKRLRIVNNATQPLMVNVHKNSISTVVRNLLSNALKFTAENGEITLEWRKNEDHVIVSVADTGVGISPDRIDLLFRVDTRYSTPGTQHEKGTGLGLVLCKEFIEKNGGKIWIASTPGVGSEFMFSIPLS